MDTPTVPVSPLEPQTPVSGPKWQTAAIVLGVLALLGAAVWVGRGYYYRVEPLTEVPIGAATSTEATTGSQQAPSLNEISENLKKLSGEICNARQVDYGTRYVLHTDLYIDDTARRTEVCGFLNGRGVDAIQNIALMGEGLLPQALSIVTIGTTNYLVGFDLYPDSEAGGMNLVLENILELKDVKTVTNIEFKNIFPRDGSNLLARAVVISGTDRQGLSFERYMGVSALRHGGMVLLPLRKAPGGFEAQLFTFEPYASFYVPYLPVNPTYGSGGFYTQNDRDAATEKSTNKAPVYFPDSCGLQDAYADARYSFSFFVAGSPVYMTVAINQGEFSTLYATTPRAGYRPEDWGKIMKTITREAFRSEVSSLAVNTPGNNVRFVDLGGYRFKHVGPVQGSTVCGTDTYNQYQARKGSAIVTITATTPEGAGLGVSQAELDAVSSILSSINFSTPAYIR